jgi:hypothetical protein
MVQGKIPAEIVQSENLAVIETPHWDSATFSLDIHAAVEIFPSWTWRIEPSPTGWDPAQFSANDFWWATV